MVGLRKGEDVIPFFEKAEVLLVSLIKGENLASPL
jgi:hypothetical protein